MRKTSLRFQRNRKVSQCLSKPWSVINERWYFSSNPCWDSNWPAIEMHRRSCLTACPGATRQSWRKTKCSFRCYKSLASQWMILCATLESALTKPSKTKAGSCVVVSERSLTSILKTLQILSWSSSSLVSRSRSRSWLRRIRVSTRQTSWMWRFSNLKSKSVSLRLARIRLSWSRE